MLTRGHSLSGPITAKMKSSLITRLQLRTLPIPSPTHDYLSFLPPRQLLIPVARHATPRRAKCSCHRAPTAPVDRLAAMSGVVRARKHVAALVASQRLSIVQRHNGTRPVPVTHTSNHVNLLTSQVLIDGHELPRPPPAAYFLFQKPAGCLTTRGSDPSVRLHRSSVMDVVRGDDRNSELIESDSKPIGRLDYESEGLLLFSNDGLFAKAVLKPEMRVPKTYLAVICGRRLPKFIDRIDDTRLQSLREGVKLGNSDDFAKAEGAEIVQMEDVRRFKEWGWDPSFEECVSLTLCEGKFREVRRMIREVGLRVTRLRRVAIGDVEDPALHFGTCRRLSEEEKRRLGSGISDGLHHDEICALHWR